MPKPSFFRPAAVLAFWCCGNAATAWEFAETSICTVSHTGRDMQLDLIFDPAAARYTIQLNLLTGDWTDETSFRLQFDGPRPLVIGTDRHVLGDDGRSLSVSDSGFGNVLDGIQFNDAMVALIGDQQISLDITEADAAMIAFRECPSAPIS